MAVYSRRKINRPQKRAAGCWVESALRKALRTTAISRVQKEPAFARRLKKVQMQGAAQSEVRGLLGTYVAAPRRVPIPMGGRNAADGPFSAACWRTATCFMADEASRGLPLPSVAQLVIRALLLRGPQILSLAVIDAADIVMRGEVSAPSILSHPGSPNLNYIAAIRK